MKRGGARFDHHGGQSVLTLRASLKSRSFGDLFDIIGASYKAVVTRRGRFRGGVGIALGATAAT
jgi:hypothetical protein